MERQSPEKFTAAAKPSVRLTERSARYKVQVTITATSTVVLTVTVSDRDGGGPA